MAVATPLNEQQVDAILSEGLARHLLEADVDGNLPAELSERTAMAQTLVGMADLAFKAGSRDDDVAAVLFIAEVEMQPQIPTGGDDVATEMTALGDDTLIKIEGALARLGEEESGEELQFVRAELERRGLRQADPGASNGAAQEPEAVDPTAPTSSEHSSAATSETADDAERSALEDRLTIGIMRVHGIDPSEISGLSIETLRWVVEHPDAPAETAPAPEVVAAEEPDPSLIETVRILPPQPVAPAPAPIPEDEGEETISAEREDLESRVTGPMLKSFGRGRNDVPGIGDNELRFMIENPEGRVTKEQLLAARELDEVAAVGVPIVQRPAEEPPVHIPVPSEESSPRQAVIEEAIAEEEAAAAAEPVAEEPSQESAGDGFSPPAAEEPAEEGPIEAPRPLPPADLHVPEAATRDAREHFDALIKREHLPIPPDIEEEPPRLPFDMSKSSVEELYSLHARFHACEARISFIITNEEDSLSDLEKMRRGREIEVASELPVTMDGKRMTDAQRIARVAADPQVQVYATAEHNIGKTLRKLKVLRDNFHRDCERSSRQLTRFSQEFAGTK